MIVCVVVSTHTLSMAHLKDDFHHSFYTYKNSLNHTLTSAILSAHSFPESWTRGLCFQHLYSA